MRYKYKIYKIKKVRTHFINFGIYLKNIIFDANSTEISI